MYISSADSEPVAPTRHDPSRAVAADSNLAEQVLDIVLKHRRLVAEHRHLAGTPTPECRKPHLAKVQRAMAAQAPLHFILPAFPAKSSNPEKTLGPLPDLGERLALRFLQSLCDQIRELYTPGARITICSDGRVFGDLVKVKDSDINLYRGALAESMREVGANDLDHFDLDAVFELKDYDAMREELLIRHATSITALRELVRQGDHDTQTMFNGIHRFILEDYTALFPGVSRNQLRHDSKTVAYRVIQRSNAWSRLVAQTYPNALRLSIHPQRHDSEKIGIMLVPCDDAWGTPWHNVVLRSANGTMSLVKRKVAEGLGAGLVYAQGRPSHFELAHGSV